MTTNVDMFERDKPKETYKAILALEKYVKDTLAANEPWHPNDVIEMIDYKVAEVKKVFLTGE
jgi:hypothetical protein